MYLKRLEMQGFKSFPDKVSLDFSQGLTMIVGPNGSGKSNISDAIRWVLGEQSAKHLRGNKMEDVIFAGTQDRKALGYAEVTIVIDNQDRKMEIDFSEITVTRRVFRSGESEYFINGAACRLKDIHEVFMDTGLGRDGYSVIGQGKIDEILSNKAEDRRQIFEEAAGISKYKYRKLEAERKLSATEDNLTRLYDILNELEGRLGPLEQQSETAKKYLVLREQLKQLEVSVSIENIAKFNQLLAEMEQSVTDVNRQMTQTRIQAETLEQEVDCLYRGNAETDEKIAGYREQISSDEGLIRQYLSEIEIFQETIRQNAVLMERLEEERKKFEDSITENQCKKEQKRQELDAMEQQTSEWKKKAGDTEAELEQAEKQVAETETVLKEKNESLVGITEEMGELKVALSHVDTLEESYRSRFEELSLSCCQKQEEAELTAEKITETEEQTQQLLKTKNEISQRLSEEDSEWKNLQDAYLSCSEQMQKQNSLLRFKRDRIKMLSDMEREFEGYQKGVKGILQNKDGVLKHLNIHGSLSQLITVDGEYVTAVETALGQALQNIVTETEEDAKKAIAFLKEKKLGRVTFLPVSSVKEKQFGFRVENVPGFLGIASDLVKAEEKYHGILSSLLGTTVVVDHLDHAVAMARQFHHKFRIVTLEGDLCNPGGSVSGGFINKQTGILSRANDRRQLINESEQLEQQLKELNEKQNELEKKRSATEKKQESLRIREREIREHLIASEAERKHLHEHRASVLQELENMEQNRKQITERTDEIKKQTEQKRKRLHEIRTGCLVLEQDVSQVRERYEEAVSRKEMLLEQKNRIRMELLDGEKNAELCKEQMHSLDSRMEFDRNEAAHRRSQTVSAQSNNERLAADVELKQRQIQNVSLAIEENRNKTLSLEQGKQGEQSAIAEKQKQAKEYREKMLLLQQECGRIENKKSKAEFEIDTIVQRLWEDYGLTRTTAVQHKIELESVSKAQKEISRLKKEISALGHINIDAIEEFKQVKERVSFLSTQKDDLTEAKRSLEKIIREMQELMKTIFSQQFTLINEYFSETFRQLFGGGNAKLYLSDPEHVLESGVEIEVQPPGKKLQNMMLLSGGEKAMCAIAILFAIIKTRPAPFCIFDEIEAALDDVNVYRFANYLRAFNDKTQFIVVTHRRGTMEAADRLYGITMEKKGISRMIMLDMDELEQFHQNK